LTEKVIVDIYDMFGTAPLHKIEFSFKIVCQTCSTSATPSYKLVKLIQRHSFLEIAKMALTNGQFELPRELTYHCHPLKKSLASFFFPPPPKVQAVCFFFLSPSGVLFSSHSPAAGPHGHPSEVAGDKSTSETARLGDQDPIHPLDLLPIRCPKHPGAAMAKMWRWAAGLQAAVKLHRRSALAWHAPTAGVVWALEAVALAPAGMHRAG
jgi:hypothetical protein